MTWDIVTKTVITAAVRVEPEMLFLANYFFIILFYLILLEKPSDLGEGVNYNDCLDDGI